MNRTFFFYQSSPADECSNKTYSVSSQTGVPAIDFGFVLYKFRSQTGAKLAKPATFMLNV